ncbi:hypothetical protein AAG906_013539 [Vitis piasezkii]
MKMLLDIEDDPGWHSADSEDENANESTFAGIFGCAGVAKHHAALIALAQIVKVCSKLFILTILFSGDDKNLEQMVTMVLNTFPNPHPRVRWATINAIGQLSIDMGLDLQVQYHQRVLPTLAASMDDFQNPRV